MKKKTPPPAAETGTAGTVWFEGCPEVPALVTREWNGYAVATVAAADVPKLFEGTGSSVKRKGSRLVIGDPDTGDREFQINRGRVSLGDGWALLWEPLAQAAPEHAELLATGVQERAAVEALLPAGVRLVDAQRSGAPVFAAVASKAALNTKEVGGLKCWQWWTSLANAEVSLRRRTTDRAPMTPAKARGQFKVTYQGLSRIYTAEDALEAKFKLGHYLQNKGLPNDVNKMTATEVR